MAIGKREIMQALGTVALPASGTPLIASGRLSEIIVEGGRIVFSIAIDPTEAAAMEEVRAAAEQAVKRIAGSHAVLVTLTADRAPQARAPSQPPRREQPGGQRGQPVAGVRHIVAVASGKGGVGKSTVACNLAIALAAEGLAVGLLDADIYGPSAPKLFGLTGKPHMRPDRTLEPLVGYGVKVMSIGFLVEEETPMIWRGPMVMSAITQMLREVDWAPLDILIVDMPPGTGDAQLTMVQATPLSGAVVVSTPQDLALIDARRGVAMFERTAVPILGIIENMSYFVAPDTGTRYDIFGHGGAQAEAERLGVPFLGEVPLEMRIRETSDGGRPLVAVEPEGATATLFRAIARQVWGTLTGDASPVKPPPVFIVE